MSEITEKEYHILSEISKGGDLSQRALSDEIELSLGMTNYLIKRMLKVGLIKVAGLNRKKVKYFLTEKGLVEKAKKTYHFISKTVHHYQAMESAIRDIISREYEKGKRVFYLSGAGSLQDVTCRIITDMNLKGIRYLKVKEKKNLSYNDNAVVLYTKKPNSNSGNAAINLTERFSCCINP